MLRHARTRILAPALVALVALLAFGAVGASAKVVKITGDKTTITPSAEAKQFLQSQGITVTPINGATAVNGSVTLAIVGGRVQSKTLNGFIRHKGGLKFTKGNRSAALTQFVLVKTPRGVGLTAVGRVQVKCKRIFHRAHQARLGRKVRKFLRRHKVKVKVRCFAQKRILVARVANATKTDSYQSVTLKGDLKLSAEAARLINRATGANTKAGAPLGSGESLVTYSVS